MKIAFIYDGAYPYTIGGIEKRMWDLSRKLVKRGNEIHFFVPKYWQGEGVIELEGILFHGVCQPSTNRFVKGRRSFQWPIYFAWKMFPKLLTDKFDLLDCQGFPFFSCFSAKIISLLRRTPLIITWHECWGDYWYKYLGQMKGLLGRATELMVSRLAPQNVAVSFAVKSDLVSLGVEYGKIEVAPNGFNLRHIERIKPSAEKYDIIYVGRLVKHKNVDVLLQVIKILAKNIPEIRCAIVGDGPERKALVKLASALKITENVAFLGFFKDDYDVFSHLKASKVFVSLSTREGFSMAVIEANACGLPAVIVDSRRNAGALIVKVGQNGYVVKLDANVVAHKIRSILEDGGLLQSLSLSAMAFSREYDWENAVDRLEVIYKRHVTSNKNHLRIRCLPRFESCARWLKMIS